MSILLVEAQHPEKGQAYAALTRYFPEEHIACATKLLQVSRRMATDTWDLLVVATRVFDATALDVLELFPRENQAPPMILLSKTGVDPIDMEMLHRGFHNLVIASEEGMARLAPLAQQVIACSRKVKERDQRYKDLEGFFTLTLEMLCILDMEADFQRFNPAFDFSLGYGAQELSNCNLFDLVHPDDRIAAHVWWKKLSEGQTDQSFCLRVQRKNRSYAHLLWNAAPVPDQGLIYATARDMSTSVEAERELRAKATHYHGMVDNLPFPVFTANKEGVIQTFNAVGEAEFGYRQSELFGVRFTKIFEGLKNISIVLKSAQKKSRTLELQANSKAGTLFPVKLHLNAFQEGKKTQYLGLIQKVQTTRHMEQNEWLAQHQRYRANQVESMKVVASSIAHDFSNLLSPMAGYTEIALADLDRLHPARESLNLVMAASTKARKTIENIYTRSKRHQPRASLDIQRAVANTLTMIDGLCPKHVEIVSQLESFDGVAVMADLSLINLLMFNLAQNSFEAIGEQPGRLEVTLKNVELQPRELIGAYHLKEGSYALLQFSDSGPGMEAEMVTKVVQPFYSKKPQAQHMGMGLTVCQKISKRLGGEMVIEGRGNPGLITKVYLPLVRQTMDNTSASRLKLLVVDDEREVTTMLKEVLERNDYNVTACNSGQEALDLFRNNVDSYDLVITDHRMPDISGIRVAEIMTHMRSNLPVILISGYGGEELENDMVASGVYKFLMKPVSTRSLLNVIKEATTVIN